MDTSKKAVCAACGIAGFIALPAILFGLAWGIVRLVSALSEPVRAAMWYGFLIVLAVFIGLIGAYIAYERCRGPRIEHRLRGQVEISAGN